MQTNEKAEGKVNEAADAINALTSAATEVFSARDDWKREAALRVEELALSIEERRVTLEWNRSLAERQARVDAREDARMVAIERQTAAMEANLEEGRKQTVSLERIADALANLAALSAREA
jgi:hypothetical protein